MKKMLLSVFMMTLMSFSVINAQNTENKSGVTFKWVANDYSFDKNPEDQFFDTDSWSHGAEIGYFHYLKDYLSLGFPLRVSQVSDFDDSDSTPSEVTDELMASLDAVLKLHVPNGQSFVSPYLFAGLGGNYVTEANQNWDAQVPMGLGLDFKLTPKLYLQTQGEYRLSLIREDDNVDYSAGLFYLFGGAATSTPNPKKTDTDLDGIMDIDDACPNDAGIPIFNGCPDSDEDGIQDSEDECPNKAGLEELNGCPVQDADNDGISDAEDACPNDAGTAALMGCPDTDGDGISDKDDACPTVAGIAALNGCIDTDGDGVIDSKDACPSVKGTLAGCPDTDGDGFADGKDKCPTVAGVAPEGCPAAPVAKPVETISATDKAFLTDAMKRINFNTGSDVLKGDSKNTLDQIAALMAKYPSYKLSIAGYTDNVGSSSSNQVLSEKRAKSCRDYLASKGVSSTRMSYAGYGETNPIDTNSTSAGRLNNRRVEFRLYLPTNR